MMIWDPKNIILEFYTISLELNRIGFQFFSNFFLIYNIFLVFIMKMLQICSINCYFCVLKKELTLLRLQPTLFSIQNPNLVMPLSKKCFYILTTIIKYFNRMPVVKQVELHGPLKMNMPNKSNVNNPRKEDLNRFESISKKIKKD